MREISLTEIQARLSFDNPWWSEGLVALSSYAKLPKRAYLEGFYRLIQKKDVHRAVILMGPRRVGKTVMVYHAIGQLLRSGIPANQILYLSLETPIYTGLSLEKQLGLFIERFQHALKKPLYIFFDEIQYLKNWEVHLKSLVDSYRNYNFIATGSAAAALKLKSQESGAGRFTDFMLPPLTFCEYLEFIGKQDLVDEQTLSNGQMDFGTTDIEKLNGELIHYLNFGGYPEAVFSKDVQQDRGRYIKSDIIDKVLLRDLPSLYGISDIQELNQLFTTIAYNTGNEVSLDALSKSSGVVKNTLKRYLEYLEAAFLIKRVRRIDGNAKHFQREMTFKVYLTNSSMRAALFGPIQDTDEVMGHLVETAIFSQWLHHASFVNNTYYARWKKGEVDMVRVIPQNQKISQIIEVKWSDRPYDYNEDLDSVVDFASRNKFENPILVTSKTKSGSKKIGSLDFRFYPSSLYCYAVSRELFASESDSTMKGR